MYNYRVQYLRQLDNSIRHHSNKTSCTPFCKDFDFSFRYGVPHVSLYGLGICRNLPLLVKIMKTKQKLLLFRTYLTGFWKQILRKWNTVNIFHIENTNTVLLVGKKICNYIQEHFLFLFQTADFSAMREVVSVSRRLVLLEGSSPCPLQRWADWSFLLNHPTPSRQTSLVKTGYQCRFEIQRLHSTDHFSSRIQYLPDQTPGMRLLCPYLAHQHLSELVSLIFTVPFLVGSNWKSR